MRQERNDAREGQNSLTQVNIWVTVISIIVSLIGIGITVLSK